MHLHLVNKDQTQWEKVGTSYWLIENLAVQCHFKWLCGLYIGFRKLENIRGSFILSMVDDIPSVHLHCRVTTIRCGLYIEPLRSFRILI
jgi:hypothetical protein